MNNHVANRAFELLTSVLTCPQCNKTLESPILWPYNLFGARSSKRTTMEPSKRNRLQNLQFEKSEL